MDAPDSLNHAPFARAVHMSPTMFPFACADHRPLTDLNADSVYGLIGTTLVPDLHHLVDNKSTNPQF